MTKAERLELGRQKLAEMRIREDSLRAEGHRFIAGIDEVGRGPLAGPVYAACVIMPAEWDEIGVNDSKKLTASKRESLSALIREKAVAYGIGIADNLEIDDINILEATKNAMKRAVDECGRMLREREGADSGIDMLLIDAVHLDTGIPQESVIKGDEKCLCIAAASIVAKVARDSYMTEMDTVYPGYDFAGNKGYGTARHYEGLRANGYTPIHRRSFLKKFEAEENEKVQKKVYAVRKGRTTGIFTSWEDCKKQIDGFSGAEYKSFADMNDAAAYLGLTDPGSEKAVSEGVRAYVDGSYDASTGMFSCGVVMVRTDAEGNVTTRELSESFYDEEASRQRNVAGEIMGAKTAIDFCLRRGIEAVTIYHDYEGIGKWADGQWKARNELTKGYSSYVAKARTRMKIEFVKVRAHAGNEYNEAADRLAKEALGIK